MAIFADFSNRAEPFTTDSPRGREWARNTRSVNDQIADAVRADSTGDGLKMTTDHDDSGRPVRSFVLEGNATKRSTWMAPYVGPAHRMLRICTQPQTPAENARFEAEQLRIAEQLANGTFQFQEL